MCAEPGKTARGLVHEHARTRVVPRACMGAERSFLSTARLCSSTSRDKSHAMKSAKCLAQLPCFPSCWTLAAFSCFVSVSSVTS